MSLQVAQRAFIEALTFISFLESPSDTRLATVGVELEEDFVTHKNLYTMQPHFARKITQHHLTVLQRDFEQRIRQGLFNDALCFWCLAIH